MLFVSRILEEVSAVQEVAPPSMIDIDRVLGIVGGPIPLELCKLWSVMTRYKEALHAATHAKIRKFAALEILVTEEFNQESPEEIAASQQYDCIHALFWHEVKMMYPAVFEEDELFVITPDWMVARVG